jgi:hypothetical protein
MMFTARAIYRDGQERLTRIFPVQASTLAEAEREALAEATEKWGEPEVLKVKW